MKKILALVLASLLVLAFVACSEEKTTTEDPAVEESTAGDITPVEPEDEPTTPATILLKAFKDMKANGEYTDAVSAANALAANEIFPFMCGGMEMAEGYLPGFNADITGFKSCGVFMPMIGSIPFVGYVFELEEGADVNAFVQTLKDNANLRWNICVSAEEMVCEAVDNTVFFCMANLSFEQEEVPADEFFEELPIDEGIVEEFPVDEEFVDEK